MTISSAPNLTRGVTTLMAVGEEATTGPLETPVLGKAQRNAAVVYFGFLFLGGKETRAKAKWWGLLAGSLTLALTRE